jgi:hypothetical protein
MEQTARDALSGPQHEDINNRPRRPLTTRPTTTSNSAVPSARTDLPRLARDSRFFIPHCPTPQVPFPSAQVPVPIPQVTFPIAKETLNLSAVLSQAIVATTIAKQPCIDSRKHGYEKNFPT